MEELYHAALERPEAGREAYLAEVCGPDTALLGELRSLLGYAAEARRLLDAPVREAETVRLPVVPGARLGRYEVGSRIGAGGMGEVYRARDTSLGRDVAIKVLPEAMTSDPEALARFRREARTIAALEHPNVCTLHDVGQHEGVDYLVMELLEGETLAQRLERGPLPLEATLRLGIGIAEALEAAHARGIVHRDLKPANVLVSPRGHVKVMDFGLARAPTGSGGAPETSSAPSAYATRDGVILGTAAYMSPEQARGHAVDARADLWALGCVLFEALSGQRAFPGRTVSDTLAAVLERDVDWRALPESTPGEIRSLLGRCLRKDPERRVRDAGDVRIELEDVAGAAAQAPPSRGARSAWRRAFVPGVLLAAALGLMVWGAGRPSANDPGRLTHAASLPTAAEQLFVLYGSLALSPDGSRVAYVAETPGLDDSDDQWDSRRIHVRRFDAPRATPLPGTEGAIGLFFSPDGQWIGFNQRGELKRVPVSGGAVLSVHDAKIFTEGGTWAPDDTILFAAGGSLWRVAAAGGPAEVLASPDRGRGEQAYRWPEILPGGRAVLYSVQSFDDTESSDGAIDALSLETGERKRLIVGGVSPRYAASGHIVYARERTLRAVRFDAERLEVGESSAEVARGVAIDPRMGARAFDVADDGTLVYLPGGRDPEQSAVWVDRQGTASPILDEPGAYTDVRLSPDQRRIAVAVGWQGRVISVYDPVSGRLNPVTHRPDAGDPVWSPDGRRIVFRSERRGPSDLLQVPADGSGAVETLLESERPVTPRAFSPDGSHLALQQFHPETSWDIWLLPTDSGAERVPFLATPFDEREPAFSPDGRWIAYTSWQTGGDAVFVTPFPGPGPRLRVSTGGGSGPRWTRGGREIVYRTANQVVAVPIDVTPEGLSVGASQVLFEGRYRSPYDVTPDGERFLMLTRSGAELVSHLEVVFNWSQHLDERIDADR